MRSAEEIAAWKRRCLGHAVRRPGVWTASPEALIELLRGLLADLCFIEERPDGTLDAEIAHLADRGAWFPANHPYGALIAWENLLPHLPAYDAEIASGFAEIARRLGFLDVDVAVEADAFAGAVAWATERAGSDVTAAELAAACGPPSLVIAERTWGWTTAAADGPWWFADFVDAKRRAVRDLRLPADTLAEAIRLLPAGLAITHLGHLPEPPPAARTDRPKLRLVRDDEPEW